MNIICNYKKCRKPMFSTAWVTSCSHAFCEEHGKHFMSNTVDVLYCPACETQLNDRFAVVQTDLNPSEEFKSIILAGMSPDIIMDVAMRAISFWSYQIKEEAKYQETMGKFAQEKAECMNEVQKASVQKMKSELTLTKNKVASLQTEFDNQKRQLEDATIKLEERNRKIQKLQHELDCQRRSSIHVNADFRNHGRSHNVSDMIVNRHSTPVFKFDNNRTSKQEDTFRFTPHFKNLPASP